MHPQVTQVAIGAIALSGSGKAEWAKPTLRERTDRPVYADLSLQ